MFIRAVDEALERMLRETLPLPEMIGDVSFDAPTGSWSAQLSRLTVNVFLYDVTPSADPARSAVVRTSPDGQPQRRALQPMIRLGYLVSAWAGSPRDEHQLLGDVLNRVVASPVLTEQYFTQPMSSSVRLLVGDDDGNRVREIWSSVGGQLKASFQLSATVAADTFDWQPEPTRVERIEAMMKRMP